MITVMRIVLIFLTISMGTVLAETVNPIHNLLISNSNGSILVKLHEAIKGKAEAVFYTPQNNGFSVKSSFMLLDGRMPKTAYVSNDGSLVTLDDWYAYGIGTNVIVIYAVNGKIHKHYSLADIYHTEQIDKFFKSSSSIYWRCLEIEPTIHGEQLHIYDTIGGELVIKMDSGNIEHRTTSRLNCPEFP